MFRKTRFLLSKVRSLKLCPLAILKTLEENPYIVPHLKALIRVVKNFGEGRGVPVLEVCDIPS